MNEKEKDIQSQQPDPNQTTADTASGSVETGHGESDQGRQDGQAPSTQSGAKDIKTSGKKLADPQSQTAQDASEPEFVEKVLSIKRVTKVTKGGKKLSFSALVVVGDAKGTVGYGLDKAGEVATAIKKSLNMAKKNMIKIHLKGTTIPHEIIGINGGAHVLLKPASEGTGVIAAGPVRAVCDGAGIHNILTKCLRSNNPINVVKATMNGLMRLKRCQEESSGE